MKAFMDKNFLLNTDTAKKLYHDYAGEMPIIDYHCHINPEEIAKDISFKNITELWLGGDHYKWRLMRASGVEESYITGDAPDRDKFQKWAQTLENAIGNPLYHWSHLELQRYFDYHGTLNTDTAQEVWDLCNKKLASPEMTARNIIKNSNVELLCTTDDPIDSLEYHKQLADDSTYDVTVLPAFRPDKAVNIEKDDYLSYLDKLSQVSGIEINSFKSLCQALNNRIDFFDSMGCKTSDHGLDFVMYYPASEEKLEEIMKKRLDGQSTTEEEDLQYKTALLIFLGKQYHRLGWVMQLHYGVKRNNNTRIFNKIGPDTGFDCIDNSKGTSAQLADFLNALDLSNELTKTIIYSLNPVDNAAIDTVMGCFEDGSTIQKIQHGSAWWFNDHKPGMKEHLVSLSSISLLGNFVGMLTDSRSFLSYTRHEYFRRILCQLIGEWVENGEFPNDMDRLGKIVQNISYNNAINYFEFKAKQ